MVGGRGILADFEEGVCEEVAAGRIFHLVQGACPGGRRLAVVEPHWSVVGVAVAGLHW